MDFDDGADSGSDTDSKPVGECSIHSGIAMCDKKIQKEEKFFYEPGGPEYTLYINGDEDCEGCCHRTVSYLCDPPEESDKYGCRGLDSKDMLLDSKDMLRRSIELRMYE